MTPHPPNPPGRSPEAGERQPDPPRSPEGGVSTPDPLGSAIQSQHPEIADEIQGAINTLHKIQQLTGKGTGRPSGSQAGKDNAFGALAPLADVPVLSAGESFGRYQVVRALGSGAMGAVYLAYDTQLQRHVALKTPFLGTNPVTIQRFYREARTAAGIRSPYVCPVYDVGQISGITFLTMAFIDGRPLSKLISEGELREERSVIEMLRKIALGVQKAHEHQIIHRDLKPDNILIDTAGDPIVMDFGLARRVDEDIQLTTPGRILGTPAYMSPEQVDGDQSKIGPASDIYSLGVILYHVLTGQLPFKGSLTSVLRQIATNEPARPSAINMQLASNSHLERICLRMMAKSVADRYESMAAVVEALDAIHPRESEAPASSDSVLSGLWSFARGLFGSRATKASPPGTASREQPAWQQSASSVPRDLTATQDSADQSGDSSKIDPVATLDSADQSGDSSKSDPSSTLDSADQSGDSAKSDQTAPNSVDQSGDAENLFVTRTLDIPQKPGE